MNDEQTVNPVEQTQSHERNVRKQIKGVLMSAHPDRVQSISPEHKQDAETISHLLYEVLKSADNMSHWSYEVRQRLPVGSEITLVAIRDGALIPPKTVPLRRPEVFLKMYETYLETGDVPAELINDDAEAEHLDEEHTDEIFHDDSDEEIAEYFDDISKAKTIEDLLGVLGATKYDSQVVLAEAGVLRALYAKAEQMILDEITAGTVDKLQLAIKHVAKFRFPDASITENLRTMIEARAETGGEQVVAAPSNVTEWEIRAAAEGMTLDGLAALAKELAESTKGKPEVRRRAQRGIDSIAKSAFVKECDACDSIDAHTQLYQKAMHFPFSEYDTKESHYKSDVLDILETRAKYFMLGLLQKDDMRIKQLNDFEEQVRRFPFQHMGNVTDLQNEIVIRRERLRGNKLSYEQQDEVINEKSGPLDRSTEQRREDALRGNTWRRILQPTIEFLTRDHRNE